MPGTQHDEKFATRTRLDPATRRAQIIAAASRVFIGKDPADVTFDDIATEAGVSRALVYNYFGEKSELLAALYISMVSGIDDHIRADVAGVEPFVVRVRRAVECYVEYAERDPALWHFLCIASTHRHGAVQEARRARFEAIGALWGDTPQTRLAAASVIGSIEFAILHWLDGPELGRTEATELIFRLVWDGLGGIDDVTMPKAPTRRE